MRIDRVKLIAEMARRDMKVQELAEKATVSRATVTALRVVSPATKILFSGSHKLLACRSKAFWMINKIHCTDSKISHLFFSAKCYIICLSQSSNLHQKYC